MMEMTCRRCLADASSQRKKLGDYARVYEAARHEYEEVKRLARFDDEIRGLKVTLAWVAVRGAEFSSARRHETIRFLLLLLGGAKSR